MATLSLVLLKQLFAFNKKCTQVFMFRNFGSIQNQTTMIITQNCHYLRNALIKICILRLLSWEISISYPEVQTKSLVDTFLTNSHILTDTISKLIELKQMIIIYQISSSILFFVYNALYRLWPQLILSCRHCACLPATVIHNGQTVNMTC